MKTRLKRNGRIEKRFEIVDIFLQTNSSIFTVVCVCTYRELRI